MIEAFPLQWPAGYPRTKYPEINRMFEALFGRERDEIVSQLRKMGATDIIISTNIPIKGNGLPYATYSKIDDHGVAVYFKLDKEASVLCCDKWSKIEWNMRAIVKTIDAMRGLDRWGVSEILKRVFTGFKALPEETNGAWWVILGVAKDATPAQIKKAYYAKAHDTHPDKGGDADEFAKVNRAYQEAIP